MVSASGHTEIHETIQTRNLRASQTITVKIFMATEEKE